MEEKEIRKLAECHWAFIEGLLFALPDENQFSISTVEYLYKESFVHGWKHAIDYEFSDQGKFKRMAEKLRPTNQQDKE